MLTSSRNIRHIITKIYVIVVTIVSNYVLATHRYCVLLYKLNIDILPANVTYNLAIVFLVFRELVSVLNNYSFHTKNNIFGVQRHTFSIIKLYYQ